MTINEYAKKNPERLKGAAVTEAIIASETKNKMVKLKPTAKLESIIFKEETRLNVEAQPFKPKVTDKGSSNKMSSINFGSKSIPSNNDYKLNLTDSSGQPRDSKTTKNSTNQKIE